MTKRIPRTKNKGTGYFFEKNEEKYLTKQAVCAVVLLTSVSNTLFLFCGGKRDRIKALYWEGNGFLLLYKRLEQGVYQWPRSENEARELTAQQYRWLKEKCCAQVCARQGALT